MGMRLSGLISGMDTDSVIQQLVAAKRTKVDKTKKAQTKLEWKTDAWEELNKKLKSFQNKHLQNMRFSSAYAQKTTKVSNSNAVSVLTGENAMNGVQSLEVDKLAKTAYLTGGKISAKDPSGQDVDVTAMTTMGQLGISSDTSLELQKEDGTTVAINIGRNTTISDVLNQLREGGVNATFDDKQKRFFLNGKESGKAFDFNIKAVDGNSESAKALETLGFSTDVPAGATDEQKEKYAVKTDGQNAVIRLNGATFTSNNNVFEINDLTFTVMEETTSPITVTTETDTSGIYDMVKEFIKDYSELVNEMDKFYNADSAKGYEPLTDEEKESMSEKQIEEWESKVKDSLLRRDGNLYTVNSALQEIMAQGVNVNGKTMYLSDFGINTLGYFAADENERHAYHIDGDKDNENTSANEDKLRKMIASDPDTVQSFFSQLTQSLYSKMSDMSSSVEGYRSFGNFYDDKKMKSDYKEYTSKIKDLEKKLTAYEDKWYAKFAAMETAMAKLQESTSAVTSLLGGS